MKNNLSFCFFDGAKVGWFSSLTNRFLLFFLYYYRFFLFNFLCSLLTANTDKGDLQIAPTAGCKIFMPISMFND